MAVKTTLEQLEEVQAAISVVMSGQEVSIGGKSLRLSDLDALSRRENTLRRRYLAETGSGGVAYNTGTVGRD